MKKRVLSILGVAACLSLGQMGDAIAEGKGGSNGGDYLLLLKYANSVRATDSILNGVLPERDAQHYRYEFIRAARSGLRKMRLLLKSGRKFKYSDETEVIFNEATLKKFSYRINDLADKTVNQFKLVESISNSRGESLTAQNYSDGRVELVPTRWDEMRKQSTREAGFNLQEAIAVHEVLGIDEIERSDEYPVAAAVLAEQPNANRTTEQETKIPPRCTSLTSFTFDLSLNYGHRVKPKPGQSHGIISSVTYSCLGQTQELQIGLGNIFSNDEGKSVPISTEFSSDLKSNDFIKNSVMARQIYCAMKQILNSDTLKDVELDVEDQYIDALGKKVTNYSYDLLDDRDRRLVYGYRGFHQALAEAFQADQNKDQKAKAAALYHANTAIGEGLLALDEALHLKTTPALFIKYTKKAYEHYAKVEFPKLLAQYTEKKRLYDDYLKTGNHPDYGWFEKAMEKLSGIGEGYLKPRNPNIPKPPAGEALSMLKACGYYNPEVSESNERQELKRQDLKN